MTCAVPMSGYYGADHGPHGSGPGCTTALPVCHPNGTRFALTGSLLGLLLCYFVIWVRSCLAPCCSRPWAHPDAFALVQVYRIGCAQARLRLKSYQRWACCDVSSAMRRVQPSRRRAVHAGRASCSYPCASRGATGPTGEPCARVWQPAQSRQAGLSLCCGGVQLPGHHGHLCPGRLLAAPQLHHLPAGLAWPGALRHHSHRHDGHRSLVPHALGPFSAPAQPPGRGAWTRGWGD